MSSWQTKSSKVVYENPWLIVHEDEVVMPSGKGGVYGYVESKNDAAYIVPVDELGDTYIIRQEHYTTRNLSWQCVAGRIEEGESIENAAKRELLEEAGIQAESITLLSSVEVATGMTQFKGTFCLARNLTETTNELDSDEAVTVKKLPLTEVRDMILAGEITNTESIAVFLMTIAYLEKEKTIY